MQDSSYDRMEELIEIKENLSLMLGTLSGMHPADAEEIEASVQAAMDAASEAIDNLREEAELEQRAEIAELEREYWASR